MFLSLFDDFLVLSLCDLQPQKREFFQIKREYTRIISPEERSFSLLLFSLEQRERERERESRTTLS